MEVLTVTENDDGSATLECEFEQEELDILLSYAVTDILKKQLKIAEESNEQGTSGD